MSHTTTTPSEVAEAHKRVWVATVIVSALVAVIGLGYGIATLFEMTRGGIAARTLWGVLVVVAGFLGLSLPVLVTLSRRQFVTLSGKKQFLTLLLIPTGYLLILALLMIAGANSVTPFVPLRVPPTVTILFGQAGTQIIGIDVTPPCMASLRGGHVRQVERGSADVQFQAVLLGSAGTCGDTDWPLAHVVDYQYQWLGGSTNTGPIQTVVAGTGTVTKTGDGRVVAKLNVEFMQAVHLQVCGPQELTIEVDDRSPHSSYSVLDRHFIFMEAIGPGKHSLVISGAMEQLSDAERELFEALEPAS